MKKVLLALALTLLTMTAIGAANFVVGSDKAMAEPLPVPIPK